MPKVSICIPAYKQVKFLEQTLKSIKEQDFRDYEVIITDDSPDEGVENLVHSYRDDRWMYVRNARRLGSPENWNAAVGLSSGELIKIMHHDDRFARKDALSLFVGMMDSNPNCGFGFSATTVEDANSGRHIVHCASDRQREELARHPWVLFAGNVVGPPSATVYRRAGALSYDCRYIWLVDLEFYFRMLKRDPCFAFSHAELVVSSHNAKHQVTQEVQRNADIVIAEYLLLMEDIPENAWTNSQVVGEWHALIDRYSLGSAAEFLERFPEARTRTAYFQEVFTTKPDWATVFARRIANAVRRRLLLTSMKKSRVQ